ncbi:unnamed protein product [Rhizophagus irregularis]|nr:unnamed protein product [Rhizophagus irregularis]
MVGPGGHILDNALNLINTRRVLIRKFPNVVAGRCFSISWYNCDLASQDKITLCPACIAFWNKWTKFWVVSRDDDDGCVTEVSSVSSSSLFS